MPVILQLKPKSFEATTWLRKKVMMFIWGDYNTTKLLTVILHKLQWSRIECALVCFHILPEIKRWIYSRIQIRSPLSIILLCAWEGYPCGLLHGPPLPLDFSWFGGDRRMKWRYLFAWLHPNRVTSGLHPSLKNRVC